MYKLLYTKLEEHERQENVNHIMALDYETKSFTNAFEALETEKQLLKQGYFVSNILMIKSLFYSIYNELHDRGYYENDYIKIEKYKDKFVTYTNNYRIVLYTNNISSVYKLLKQMNQVHLLYFFIY